MPADQMIALIRGKLLVGEDDRGGTYRTLVRPDLSASVVIITRAGRELRDTGHVRQDGDRLCWAWNEIRDGNERCSRVFRRGDRFWTVADDDQITSYTIRSALGF